MKVKLLVLAAGIVFSSLSMGESKPRNHFKCYLQLADKSDVVRHFVTADKDQQKFVSSLPGRDVFMADGISAKKIRTVYECVESDQPFKAKEGNTIEANTPF